VTIRNRVRTMTAGAWLSAGYRAIAISCTTRSAPGWMKIKLTRAVPMPWYAKTKCVKNKMLLASISARKGGRSPTLITRPEIQGPLPGPSTEYDLSSSQGSMIRRQNTKHHPSFGTGAILRAAKDRDLVSECLCSELSCGAAGLHNRGGCAMGRFNLTSWAIIARFIRPRPPNAT
jgi:hypothetical protein